MPTTGGEEKTLGEGDAEIGYLNISQKLPDQEAKSVLARRENPPRVTGEKAAFNAPRRAL